MLVAPSEQRTSIDWKRTGKMTAYGILFSAPAFAFWYSFLDRWSHLVFAVAAPGQTAGARRLPLWLQRRVVAIAPTTLRTWKIIGFKLFADTILFDPLYLTLFFTATSLMEGRTLEEILRKLKEDLVKTYCVDVAVWTPIQTMNFRWVPVIYQPLVVQSCNIGWNAYLSHVQHRH